MTQAKPYRTDASAADPFALPAGWHRAMPRPLWPFTPVVASALRRTLCLRGLNDVYHFARDACAGDAHAFADAALDYLGVSAAVRPSDLARVPAAGPVIAVANHPLGGVEGLIFASMLLRRRPDTRLLVNGMLGVIPELRPLWIEVDVFNPGDPRSVRGLRQAMRHLKDGGLLGVFPAGEVSRLELRNRRVTDAPWSRHVAALAVRSGASVVPVRFTAANGPLFHLAGLASAKLRTAMLPRETLNKRGRRVAVCVGTPVPASRLAALPDDSARTAYLRGRVEALPGPTHGGRVTPRFLQPIPAAVPAGVLARAFARLGEETVVAQAGPLRVHLVDAGQVPDVMPELGRLREVTFREVGEGSGLSRDLDRFDPHYHHLLLWDADAGRLAGAYRLGRIDDLVRRQGLAGLYTATLFRYDLRLFDRLPGCLELGRSFIAAEYQRKPAALLLLWRGIAAAMNRWDGRHLIGPASVSGLYRPSSRAMIARDLSRRRVADLPPSLMPRPRRPLVLSKHASPEVLAMADRIACDAELDEVIADGEPSGRGLPVLLRHYLRLGARVLGFNVDPGFGGCLDCLMLFDRERSDARLLRRLTAERSPA